MNFGFVPRVVKMNYYIYIYIYIVFVYIYICVYDLAL